MNVRLRGAEARVWFHELPVEERREWRAAGLTREAHLRALLPRVHPVYFRAAVALAGAMKQGPDAAPFAEDFPSAWREAQTTAAEIRALLTSTILGN